MVDEYVDLWFQAIPFVRDREMSYFLLVRKF